MENNCDNSLHIELLKLATIIARLTELKDEKQSAVIKFAWHSTKSEDLMVKYHALLSTCVCATFKPCPDKLMDHLYVILLKSWHTDIGSLVQEALDCLVPVLFKKFENEPGRPKWIVWTRKILIEESHNGQAVKHILQLIMRHPHIFFKYQFAFIAEVFDYVKQNGIFEVKETANKNAAKNLVDLMFIWDRMVTKNNDGTDAPKKTNLESTLTPSGKAKLMISLLHMATRNQAGPPTAEEFRKTCEGLFFEAVELSGPGVNVPFVFVMNLLATNDVNNQLMALKILANRPNEYLVANIARLQTSLLPLITSEDQTVIYALVPVLKRLLEIFKSNTEELSIVLNHIADLLQSGGNQSNLVNVLHLLENAFEPSTTSAIFSELVPHLVSNAVRLVEEYKPVADQLTAKCLSLCAAHISNPPMTTEIRLAYMKTLFRMIEQKAEVEYIPL